MSGPSGETVYEFGRDGAAWKLAEERESCSWRDAERAYRRGYQQGWMMAVDAVEEFVGAGDPYRAALGIAKEHGGIILHDWRYSRSLDESETPPPISPRFRRRTPLGLKERIRIIERCGRVCYYCGGRSESVLEDQNGEAWHIDHRLPVSRGGSNHAANLVLSCADCNGRKGARFPGTWTPR